MVQSIHTEIEISSSPSEVKKIFFDFANFPEWQQVLKVTPLSPNMSLQPGDKLKIEADGTTLTPTILENSTEHFYWQGNFMGLLKGKHMWRFLESEKTSGGTTFVQAEEFSGPLAFLFAAWWPTWLAGMRGKTVGNFESLNGSLKQKVESLGR